MRKITLTGLLMLFLTNVIFAQHSPVQFGLKGGVNFSSLSGSGDAGEHRTSIHAGGLAHIHLSKNFAVQPEILYSSQGAEYANDQEYRLRYINVPLLAQYMWGNGFRLQTGPQVGFLAKKSATVANHQNVDNSFRKADVSWSFGTGYLTKSGLGIDARYNLGLNDISKNNSNIKNRVWQVGLFYQFR